MTREPKLGRVNAWRVIINVMCNRGYMSGWCGDTSAKFRDYQLSNALSMTRNERRFWMENNRPNLRSCRVPFWVLMIAQG